MNRQGQTIVLD